MNFLNLTTTYPSIELGINIDHIATLRNVRGTLYPDPIKAALEAEKAGADLITLHLREDRRHINEIDVEKIHPLLHTRMNLEAAVTNKMIDFACRIKPHDVCLVPEKRKELTTEGGLDVIKNFDLIQAAVKRLQILNIRVSLFIDPDIEQIQAAVKTGVTVIELHTGRYVKANDNFNKTKELERIKNSTLEGIKFGLKINAGHGLHYTNVQAIAAIPFITELNIGHAIVAHAIFSGWYQSIKKMKAIILKSRLITKSGIEI